MHMEWMHMHVHGGVLNGLTCLWMDNCPFGIASKAVNSMHRPRNSCHQHMLVYTSTVPTEASSVHTQQRLAKQP